MRRIVMFVKKIVSYDVFSQEADILVSDNTYDILCYCYPTEDNILGAKVKEIVTLFASDIVRNEANEYCIKKDDQPYSYLICGKVVDLMKPRISIGQILIILDQPLPKDIKKGEFVELRVDRFDCEIM